MFVQVTNKLANTWTNRIRQLTDSVKLYKILWNEINLQVEQSEEKQWKGQENAQFHTGAQ